MTVPVKRHGLFNRENAGSVLSATAGWAALNFGGLVKSFFSSEPPESHWFGLLPAAIFSGVIIFLVWLLVLLPLYLHTPRNSLLWWWPICTACGIACGTLLMCALLFVVAPRLFGWPSFFGSLYVGVVVGGTTCLFGSLTASYFRWAH